MFVIDGLERANGRPAHWIIGPRTHTHTHTRARTHAHKKKGEKNHNHPMNCRRCERAAVVVGVQWLDDGVVASRG